MERIIPRQVNITPILIRIGKLAAKLAFVVALFTIYRLYTAPHVETYSDRHLTNFARRYDEENYATLDTLQSEYETSALASTNSLTLNTTPIPTGKSGQIITLDPRILAMRQFLLDYNSPMYPYSEVFIVEADKYGLDWRLVASITGVESAFGNLIPYQSNNGWGWRGGPNGDFSNFATWSEGIAVVTEGLAVGYGTTLTPFQIEPTYCPPCGRNPAHAWANGVTKYMNELSFYVVNLEN